MSDSAPTAPPEVESSIGWQTVVPFVVVATAVFILRYAAAVFVPVILAVLVSYALDPAVIQLAHWRIPRPLGAMLVVLGVLSGLGGTGFFLRDHEADLRGQTLEQESHGSLDVRSRDDVVIVEHER
jgi:predicted PurR-regulated permease PerM